MLRMLADLNKDLEKVLEEMEKISGRPRPPPPPRGRASRPPRVRLSARSAASRGFPAASHLILPRAETRLRAVRPAPARGERRARPRARPWRPPPGPAASATRDGRGVRGRRGPGVRGSDGVEQSRRFCTLACYCLPRFH